MKINLETLSPVHIGSGVQYQGNAEYIYFEHERVLTIIDESRVLDIIGPENIHIWVGYIESRENQKTFLEYLRQRSPNIKPEDIALRIIPLKGKKLPVFSNTLREQIHSGTGKPYLPGSSLKGSIRTALFSSQLMNKYGETGVPREKLGTFSRDRRFDIKDKVLQSEVFGKDPNSDSLRMLQVGDCYFSEGTNATFAETLNEKGGNHHFEIKNEVRQLVEYIPSGRTAEFDISVPEKQRDLIFKKEPGLLSREIVGKLEIKTLFKLLHSHSVRLLENEIAFFEDADLPESADRLHDFLHEMLADAKKYKENECLLRLGFGVGHRSMTGDWVRFLVNDDETFDEIATKTRRNPRYNHLRLPKSRKMMFDGRFMGYVKLTSNF